MKANRERSQSNQEIVFDPNDWAGMVKLMDEHGDSKYPFDGKNEDGEDVSISIAHDQICVVTYQSNGWVRKNFYYRDEDFAEELFEGRWK